MMQHYIFKSCFNGKNDQVEQLEKIGQHSNPQPMCQTKKRGMREKTSGAGAGSILSLRYNFNTK
jgi:hypothetical protein